MKNLESIARVMDSFRADPASPHSVTAQKAVFLARRLQQRATELQTPAERRQQAELDRMLQTPQDKVILTQMTDQAFRAHTPHRAVEQFIHILDVQGVPRFFSPIDRTLLRGFQSFGAYAPGVAVPLVKDRMRKETANVILPAERELLLEHLRARHAEGVRMNVNFLGEAILGEEESQRRLQEYLQALQLPEIEVASIKVSTLYSQISPLARDHTVDVLSDRLELLYRTAARMTYTRQDGTKAPKFVYLDMEEYRDMRLTSEAFMRTLDRRGLERIEAGIALQAYVPDSYLTQLELNEWAHRRVASGGAPITIRLVKGANMETERLEASIKGWPQAPYRRKLDTDANFKRMLLEGMKPENLQAVRLGVASHNLFDLALGLTLAWDQDALDRVQFEMLEGMANHQRRALFELSRNVLLYAPVCPKENFINAIGYLIRRLDENTGPDNFLRHAFRIQVDSPEWKQLEEGFVRSLAEAATVSTAPRRNQNRLNEIVESPTRAAWQEFVNEPDTDFSLPQNGEWAKKIIDTWEPRHGSRAPEVPLVFSGREVFQDRAVRDCADPSRPGAVVGRYRQATAADVDQAVECALADKSGWRRMPPAERCERLGRVAVELRRARGDLIGAALANGGKLISESDPEVSEAVDFVEFYCETAKWFQERPGLRASAKGVVVVVSPWNFPVAIPCGGVAAAIAAGNTVILKPASDAVLVAWEMCQCFWRAGVPREVLQFLPCAGGQEGLRLVSHPGVGAVVLTGGTSTAFNLLEAKPSMNLFAETGGKNATLVTALSDRDLAIKHVLQSAFSHSGQKCSATSLFLLEAEVYDDPGFRRSLCDAVQSLPVGSAWDLKTKVGPLIRPPSGDLENGLKVLEPGESWALLPRELEANPNLWSPGIKWGVQPGSYTHLTEFFGPVLGVMRFKKLAEAIEIVNQTGYGLTSGLESLDEREHEQWKEGVRAGNLYINRATTGAIVLRQPFGGMGKSAFGTGMKAGGPNYVAQLMDFADAEPRSGSGELTHNCLAEYAEGIRRRAAGEPGIPAAELAALLTAVEDYGKHQQAEFGQAHDHFRLVGQDNFRRYLPVRGLRIRVHPSDSLFDLFARVGAGRAAGCRMTVSLPPNHASRAIELLEELTESWAGGIEFLEESDEEVATEIRSRQTDRIRYAAPDRVPEIVHQAAAETGACIVSRPVVQDGRVELLWYLQEQSLSIDYHRYGNLGARAAEARTQPQ